MTFIEEVREKLKAVHELLREGLGMDLEETEQAIAAAVNGEKIVSSWKPDRARQANDLMKEAMAIAAAHNTTVDVLMDGRFAAVKTISEKTEQARALLAECSELAKKHNITFSFGMPGSVSDTFDGNEGGWEHSAIC